MTALDLDLVVHPPDKALLTDLVRLLDQVLDAQFLQRMNDADRTKIAVGQHCIDSKVPLRSRDEIVSDLPTSQSLLEGHHRWRERDILADDRQCREPIRPLVLVAGLRPQHHLRVRPIAVVLPVGNVDRDSDAAVGETLHLLLSEGLEELLVDLVEVLAQLATSELFDRVEVGIAIRRSHLTRRLVGKQPRPLFGGRVRHPHVALKIVERGVWVLGVIGSLGPEMISDVPMELCRHGRQLLGSDWVFILFGLAPDQPIGSSGLLRVDSSEIRLLKG